MRKIKREYHVTHYTVLKYEDGKLNEAGVIHLEGDPDMDKARKKAIEVYPGMNVLIGETNTETAIYSMDVQKFLELADKEVVNGQEG